VKTRFIHVIADRPFWGAIWDGQCRDGIDHHRATLGAGDVPPSDSTECPKREDRPTGWRPACERCGAAPSADAELDYFSGVSRIYNTASGRPEPGDIYEASWYPPNFMFDDVERHLVCVLPNGHDWLMTGRASNCTMPEDRKHRCWVVHEEAPGIFHVDKNGLTCAAGAGSIAVPGYHGFLHHGELTP
jgi:hypothetical protein